jgi:heme-degrading monooxygenase HmoA
MIRVVVLYEDEPDATAYAEHAAVCERVPGGTFRHGKVFGSPIGEPQHRYYAEWEFADEEAFRAATSSDEFKHTGRDARDRGLPRPTVQFVNLQPGA